MLTHGIHSSKIITVITAKIIISCDLTDKMFFDVTLKCSNETTLRLVFGKVRTKERVVVATGAERERERPERQRERERESKKRERGMSLFQSQHIVPINS